MAYGKKSGKQYARTDQIRAHLFMDSVGTAQPDPIYYSCLGIDAMTHDLGDITPVEVPDPDRYGEYVIVDGIPGQRGRWTTTMTTRMPIGEESPLRALERRTRSIDVHLCRGICDVPTDYNSFQELEVWEDVLVTSYSTSAVAALSSDARESTTEQVDVSIGNVYKVYNMLYGLNAVPSEASGVPQGIVVAPSWCSDSSECGITFVASKGHLYFVTKSGAVDTTYALADIAGLAMVGNRLIVARDTVGFDVVLFDKNGITSTISRTIAAISTIDGIGSNGRVGAISSGLKIHAFDSSANQVVTSDVTTLAGAAATKIVDISVEPNGCMAALSDKGYTMYSQVSGEWKAGTVIATGTPVGTAIAAMDADSWLAGTSTGEIYMTADAGATWTEVLNVTGGVNSIHRVTAHVVYAGIGSSLYRSTDGGATWTLEPSVQGRTFVSVTSVNQVTACPDNPNHIVMTAVASAAMRVVTGRPG